MVAVTPTIEPEEGPITERTRALQAMENRVTDKLQDITAAVCEIKAMLEAQQQREKSLMAAIKRAVNQFFSQV